MLRLSSIYKTCMYKESEPLGQRIEPVDPSPGYPDEYTEITDIASQPEWNCALLKEFSGGFFNMPVECQKKEAELMNFSIAGALRSMENPQRISSAAASLAAPGAEGQASPAAASAETTMATQKPPDCDETDSGDVIRICTQVPGDGGEVNIEDPDVPGDVYTYANISAIRLTKRMTDGLRENIEKYLSKECKTYIAGLVEVAANRSGSEIKSKKVLELFDLVASNDRGPDVAGDYGGIWGYTSPGPGSTAGGNWNDGGVASIGLNMARYARDGLRMSEYNDLGGLQKIFRIWNSFNKFSRTEADAFTVIHELLHLSLVGGGDGDVELAGAALSLTGECLDLSTLSTDEGIKKASAIWSNRLTDACGAKRKFDQAALDPYIKPMGGN